MNDLPAGWTMEKVRTLGARKRAGGAFFNVGRRTRIRGVPLPGRKDWGLLATNELGDLRLYANLTKGEPEDIPILAGGDASKAVRIGWSSTGTPGQYRHMTILPRPDGAWDLLDAHHWAGKLEYWRKQNAGPELLFHPAEVIGTLWGAPEAMDWARDGVQDLLVGAADGKLLRLPRLRSSEKPAFETPGQPVLAQGVPIELAGPIMPCVVDWDGAGRSDLLIGTGDGDVLLYRDVGEKEPAFARPRQLLNAKGYLRVKGPACPTVLYDGRRRWLLVADGDGVVWSWPIDEVKSYITSDLFAAAGGIEAGVRPAYAKGQWWMLDDGEGRVLAAAPEKPHVLTDEEKKQRKPVVYDPPVPELSVALPAEGYAEIHITFRAPRSLVGGNLGTAYWTDHFDQQQMLKARLSDEPLAMILQPGEQHNARRQEVFFKAADLTGRRLCLQQMEGFLSQEGGIPAYIESIRVTPMKPRPALKRRGARIPVAGIADAVDWYLCMKVNTPAEVDEMVEQHRMSGMDLIYYKLGGGCWEYPSRIPMARSVVPDLPGSTEYDKAFVAKRIACQEMINRVQHVAEACHRRGMLCYGWMRIQNHGERIHGKGPLDRFYVEHPQFLEQDFEGRPVSGKLCLGYPEVRAFHIALIEEAMDLGCDGILMDTMRHLPKVMYGEPVVAEFRQRYGLDMRKLPPLDERVMAFQVEVFTRFLREARAAMLKKKPDAKLHIRICRPYPLMGCDPALWAREGVADEIMIEDRKENKTPDIAGLAAAVRGTACAPTASFTRTHWGSEKMPLHPYRIEKEVGRWLKAGAKRIVFYETAGICDHPELCRTLRRLNDPNELSSRIY